MVDDDLIRQLSEDESNHISPYQSDTPEHESNSHHHRETSWRLMFPEATEDDPPTYPLDNDIDYQSDDHVISIDALDVISPFAVLEGLESARKSASSSSGSSSDDLIFPGENLLKHSNVSNSETHTDTSNKTCSLLLHSPPVQEMHRDGNYDLKRIPSAVFKRSNSVAPGEWSVASNDSLFSLQLGNNASIDREQSILLSGEFKKLEDLSEFSEEKEPPTKLCKTSISLPDTNDFESEGSEDQTSKIVTEEPQEMLTRIDEDKQQQRQSVHSSSISLRSNTSEDSNYSFAFPLLDDGEKNLMPKGPNFPMSHQPNIIPKEQVSRSKCCFYGLPFCACSCSLFSCFSCLSCTSWTSCFSCKSCTSCFSCDSCTSCFSCGSCTSCFSCFPCCSCSLCPSCISCQTCRFSSCCTTKKSLSLKCC